MSLLKLFSKFLYEDEGSISIEYALVVSIIAIGTIVSLGKARDAIKLLFDSIVAKISL